ncbi:porin family protein [Saprospiraceae bacterium]|nr:porin family protein [Saprospiraceae bacterium]
MKQFLSIAFIFLFSYQVYGQEKFETGYYIDNSGNKIEGFVENLDWRNNPEKITFKKNSNSSSQVIEIDQMRAFGITDICKFSRQQVAMDISSIKMDKLSTDRAPNLEEMTVMLRILIDGELTLYQHSTNTWKQFFLEKDDVILPLIYKKYRNYKKEIFENKGFHGQLWESFRCPSLTTEKLQELKYTKTSLTKFVKSYYVCNNMVIQFEPRKKKRNEFHLYAKLGARYADVFFRTTNSGRTTLFPEEINPRVGFDFEYMLPFRNGHWSLIAEPAYQFYKAETATDTINYQSIEMPIGFRYYYFFNQKSKVYVQPAMQLEYAITRDLKVNNRDFDLGSGFNVNLNIGYMYGPLTIEAKLGLQRQLLVNYLSTTAFYNHFTLTAGYRIF